MKRESSLKIKYVKKLKTSLELVKVKVTTETPKKEKKLKKNNSTKKKQRKDFKEALIEKIKPNNIVKEPTVPLSKFSEMNFILSPNKPKDIINKLIMKKIDKKKLIERIKFVKSKLYENHGYPYLIHNYYLSNENTPPLIYDYYKINKILNNAKCRLVSRLHDFTILFNKNEYLIRYSTKKDYYIIIKYLLFYVYAYDRLTYCKKCQKYYDLNEVKIAYKNLVSNKNSEEEAGAESSNLLIRSFPKKQGNNNYRLSKFNSNFKLEKISESNKTNYSIKNNSRYAKRHSISYGISNNNTNLLNLSSTSKTKLKDSKILNTKLENINEYYIGLGGELNANLISSQLKKPNYLFITDIPFTLVPNCLTNLFPIKYDFFNILESYENKIYKLKLNLFSNNKDKKPKKNYLYNIDDNNHYIDHDKKYNEFIKNISFSGEDFYKEYGKENLKKDFLHNSNRRLKNDIDILEIENLIALFEDTPKKNKNKNNKKSSNNDEDEDKDKDYSSSSSSSSSGSSSSKLNEKEYIRMKSKFANTNNQKKNNINNLYNKKSSSISIKSKSNNFHSSKSFSSNLKSKESEEINKKSYKNVYNVKLNTEISNSIIKNGEDEKRIKIDTNKTNVNTLENKNSKNIGLNDNKNVKSVKNIYNDKIIKSNIGRYNNEINKRRINLFKINNSLNKNKKYILSSDKNKNKMKLVKSTDKFKKNQNKKIINYIEYMPIITDKNNHNKLMHSTNPKILSFDKQSWSSYNNSKSRPNSGKFNFKQTYEFAFGKYEERNQFKYRMNLIKDITTEFQRKSLFSKNKNNTQQKEYFPNLDFFINCRMKDVKHIETEKNDDINNKNRYLTIQSMDKSNLKEKRKYTLKI